MKRLLALVALGAVLGSFVLHRAGEREASTVSFPPTDDPGLTIESTSEGEPAQALQLELLTLVTGPFGDAERAAVEALATRASAAELASLARFVSSLPNLRGRAAALDVLLARYVALDADAALALARELGAADELLAALVRDGTLDLPSAMRDAERLSPAQRRRAFARLAAIAVERDAIAALIDGGGLADEAEAEFSAAVLREWARRDVEAMLRYVLSLDAAAQQAALETGGLDAFAQLEPARLLELAQQLPGELGQYVHGIALTGLASRDPHTAVLYVEMLPPGPERTRLLSVVASGYAAVDPEGALAWAESLRPPAPGIVASVLAGFARADPVRVIDMLLAVSASQQRTAYVQSLIRGGALSDEQVAALADRWPMSSRGRNELRTFTAAWAQRSPEQAMEWLLANGERAPRNSFEAAAESLGRREDTAAAEAYLQRIPGELRPQWLKATADGYAQTDARAAARWLAQHAGDSGYDSALATVAQRTARSDPAAAARLLANVDFARAPESVDAANVIAARWTVGDAPAARSWALGLPSGELRDAALAPVVAAFATQRGVVDPTLLAAFGDDAAAQRALSQAVVAVARTDARAAQRLADGYLVDPELRREAERIIAVLP